MRAFRTRGVVPLPKLNRHYGTGRCDSLISRDDPSGPTPTPKLAEHRGLRKRARKGLHSWSDARGRASIFSTAQKRDTTTDTDGAACVATTDSRSPLM